MLRCALQAMSTLEYYLSTVPADCPAACSLGALPVLVGALSSSDAPVREAALQLLLRLAGDSSSKRVVQQVRSPPCAANSVELLASTLQCSFQEWRPPTCCSSHAWLIVATTCIMV
jgi:hypothetical protein